MNRLTQLAGFGQSVWYDNIERSLLDEGGLHALVSIGITGVTSNPTIFHKAISESNAYDATIAVHASRGGTSLEIYERLALDDIGRAADILRPVYESSHGEDGYVSLEVEPALAHDAQATVGEARRLFAVLGRPNVMIKVPATTAGVAAVESLIADGVNVNATLIFSQAHYEAVADAYLRGLERRQAAGEDLTQIASVASFFVSRVDSAVDRALGACGAMSLQGTAAIANAKAAYAWFVKVFSSARWQTLAAAGAQVQRPLWASTGTKNPQYSDTLYIDALVGRNTVNTVPPATLDAFLDHGMAAETLTMGLDEATEQLSRLTAVGIDLSSLSEALQAEGVQVFAASFDALLHSIEEKAERLRVPCEDHDVSSQQLASRVEAAMRELERGSILPRIWDGDHTVWSREPREIANRLGWLWVAEQMRAEAHGLQTFAREVRHEGFTDVLLLGMGGSSLAPELFGKVFGASARDGLRLHVLDSTDPGAVRAHARQLDPAATLVLVATKSGGTEETLSFLKYYYGWCVNALGRQRAGQCFVAITDPGSRLETLAREFRFRAVFLSNPNLGGRYAALSHFGLVPAALVGVEIGRILDRAVAMAARCRSPRENEAVRLGATLAELAHQGRDKLTFVVSREVGAFGDWVEQLIAESTGKQGKGILPVVNEDLGSPSVYGDDRLFVDLRLFGDPHGLGTLQALRAAGHPLICLPLADAYDLGGQFFLWELATAIAGHRLGIHPFDQPDVEAAKLQAREAVRAYRQTGELPEETASSPTSDTLRDFLAVGQPGDYVALQAYIMPDDRTDNALQNLRTRIRDAHQLATTVGYGPRFLHSTGQLHKGDRGNGLFVQLTADAVDEVWIPDEMGSPESSMTFGVLQRAQALGDRRALENAGRRVIRLHLGLDVVGTLDRMAAMVG